MTAKKKSIKIATRVRAVTGFAGEAALYELSDGSFVIASAVVAYSGPETLLFPATSDGEISDWGEIGGGRGYLDHAEAFRTIGYEVSA